MSKASICLWFDGLAEDAANFSRLSPTRALARSSARRAIIATARRGKC